MTIRVAQRSVGLVRAHSDPGTRSRRAVAHEVTQTRRARLTHSSGCFKSLRCHVTAQALTRIALTRGRVERARARAASVAAGHARVAHLVRVKYSVSTVVYDSIYNYNNKKF